MSNAQSFGRNATPAPTLVQRAVNGFNQWLDRAGGHISGQYEGVWAQSVTPRLIAAFYKADPRTDEFKAIVRAIEDLPLHLVPQIDLASLPARRECVTADFNRKCGKSGGPREWDIDQEHRALIGVLMRTGLTGVARGLVEDRIHTLSAERSYRMMGGSYRGSHQRKDGLLENALAARL